MAASSEADVSVDGVRIEDSLSVVVNKVSGESSFEYSPIVSNCVRIRIGGSGVRRVMLNSSSDSDSYS
ncbi:hypothetical protein AGABI1DRAFT_120036 [Agaricus bisporus var. burnettii JB137-S8]|uniref:Uncharacterized protein n=1 Tax=Agaricus bisporus var. burnettii (strain JB137-S8 / ATCC MYA-4627 / FGSC 10392) TaxID=597362 RepID=K5XAA8_AGABU|nr:hypothetical protein AGABI2DRAFT_188520 [Agaricus bisporus var. bisporus H97]XP_007329277.1 uncharacterized protein AGABI1DRAFT_120036 [Agaricus bisporus var. burnettii JB137-S8]EKM79997.1 hypothetical protein AGABI1DRAFT_120036 [Agaricus bisporus var. burnettii JB137-S8]EKV42342.1 hypothetical protein AGABI2DRAFT_188520 [Agaricus bisporus var. bisporus H97]